MDIEEVIKNRVILTLKTIYDPEMPVDIWELGLIYHVKIEKDGTVEITMTLTSPNCPVAESLPQEVYDRLKVLPDVKDVKVNITFEPPWDQDMISDEGLLELGFL